MFEPLPTATDSGPAPSEPARTPADLPPALEERIRVRAYEISQERDGMPGDPVDDWLRAEAEVMAPRVDADH